MLSVTDPSMVWGDPGSGTLWGGGDEPCSGGDDGGPDLVAECACEYRGTLSVREDSMRSWFDSKHARVLAGELELRLLERCKGERGVCITLTYDRDRFSGAADCFFRGQAEQHVSLFMRRLSRRLGESLKGRWMCKLEFQRAGWVHWHLIVLGVKWLDHDVVRDAWGQGHVWVTRMNRRRIGYACKYVAKDGHFPRWVLALPVRSVKVVRVSPGFWGESKPRCESDDDPVPDVFRLPAFTSIGARLERSLTWSVIRYRGRFCRVSRCAPDVVRALVDEGWSIVGCGRSWRWLERRPERAEGRDGRNSLVLEPANPDTGDVPRWVEELWRDREWMEAA